MKNAISFGLLAGLGLLVMGCGGAASDICDAQAQCEGGNDADIDACVAEYDGGADVADAYDCGDAWDKYIDCVDRTGNCDSKNYTANCNDEAEALQNCEKSASALD